MNDAQDETGKIKPQTALERAQLVSRALSEAARRSRFSSRARSAYRGANDLSRRGERFMRLTRIALFVIVVLAPCLAAALYYGLLASDQYVAEAKFTVSSGAIPKMDGFGSVTGLPPMAIMQDTMIVTHYIESRALVERLERQERLRDLYSNDSIDYFARFDRDKPIEKFVKYWGKMAKTSIAFPAGIVTLDVIAFTATDAKHIADAVIARCEALINQLNERMYKDMVSDSEGELQRAAEKLKAVRAKFESARNAEGTVDVRQTGQSISDLLTHIESDLLREKSDFKIKSAYISHDSPTMRISAARIGTLEKQVADLRAQITNQREDDGTHRSLSEKMTTFSNADFEQKLAEKRYALASAAVEQARMLSERKVLYLHQIVAPALPEDARYPRRLLYFSGIVGASFVLWGILVALVGFVRDNMA